MMRAKSRLIPVYPWWIDPVNREEPTEILLTTNYYIMKMNQQIKTTMSLATAMGSLALAAGTANAAITIVNPGFETNTGTGGSTAAPWMRGSNGSARVGISSYAGLGVQVDPVPGGGLYAHYNNGASESIYQVLSDTLAANTTYTLTIQAIDRTDLAFQDGELRLGYAGTDDGSTGDMIANDFYGENLLSPTVVFNPNPVNGAAADDGWEDWSYTFVTGASPAGLGEALRVEIVGSGVQSTYDNISLTAVAVPEPSTTALLGLGGLALILRRRK